MSEPNNPPLFWTCSDPMGVLCEIHCEVTLRDFFAAFALAGWMAHPTIGDKPQMAGEEAYMAADAMLAEREKAG